VLDTPQEYWGEGDEDYGEGGGFEDYGADVDHNEY
jgi:hypothetical protein